MTEILSSEITSGYIDGSGVFDELMTSVDSRLVKEYEAGRIKGSDYSTVYLGSMQAVLDQSIKFLLSRQTADKQAELLEQQRLESVAKVIRDDNLATASIALTNKQTDKTQEELELLIAKQATEQAQVLDTVNGNTVVGLIGKQKNLYQKQADGFDRDAEQKILKLFVDLYSIAKSSDPDAITNFRWFSTTSGYTDELENSINAAVQAAGLPQVLSNVGTV